MQLLEAFGVPLPACIAIVGSGGKTTIMYRLAGEVAAGGGTAVIGGTTRFTPPRRAGAPPLVVVQPDEDPVPALRAALRRDRTVVCTTGRGDKGRWLPISPEQVDTIVASACADLVVLEADGSRNRPFKAPGEREPVVPASASAVLAVVGLDVVGQRLTDACVHRPERVAALTGLALGDRIEAETVATVLLSADGGRKNVSAAARWIPVLNKAEPERRPVGEAIATRLLQGGAERAVVTAAEAPDPVVLVLRGANAR